MDTNVTVSAYLDHNAGSPARPEVVAAVAEVLREPGNPSSVHAWGRRAHARMERARAAVARLVDADPAGVVFTSGGTEANALALTGCRRPRILVSAVEHASVLAHGSETVAVDASGRIDLDGLDRALAADPRPAVVSVMLANNETGILQPVAEAAAIAHARGALIHCDAAQGPGRVAVSLSRLGVDFLTLSAHKLGGVPGCGALLQADPAFALAPFLLGGGQEHRRRAGTENLSGIVGFAAAADDIGCRDAILDMRDLRDHLEAEIGRRVPAARIIGQDVARLCNTTCVALPGVASQVQVMALDLAGVMVSAGSACSSGKVAESAVLRAMGLGTEVAGSAIRISLGPQSTRDEIDVFLAQWVELARRKGLDTKQAA